jgi:hypothetical protein
LLLFLLKHAQKNKTLNKHLTSKLQFSQNFTPDSVADSNDRAKCDVSVFMIFEWTLRCRSIVKKNYKNLRFFYFKVKLFFKNLFFFNFHIWATDLIPYNALSLEFGNFETPCTLGHLRPRSGRLGAARRRPPNFFLSSLDGRNLSARRRIRNPSGGPISGRFFAVINFRNESCLRGSVSQSTCCHRHLRTEPQTLNRSVFFTD